ncbi:RimJ/RimL family protein N-acetyltransferase [Clavibacter sp. B3I6]|jgi:RimJ/RimL family protein N-acetyltransferase|uniref:GNAT family N-acetyltransferase n=1 Tax=Clavibacter sp. B3I6 TaxID=3042268 RepID=UPI0027823DC8|nr:GNAT family N-acetyltransferase [Clavibacter sp. B3I6]MDQ0744941.1 RimJ/RimL family protein N-acetyltransferase [Clavibacter sp. B3I6]
MTTSPATVLVTARFALEPLVVAHAGEMVGVLADPALYRFTGGEPPTLDALRARFARQAVGRSPDGSARWLVWVIRVRASGRAAGFVQATVTGDAGARVAEVAWLVGTAAQGSGAAAECAAEVLAWLREDGVGIVRANIHPDHAASQAVARRLGLAPTDVRVEGEARWELRAG